MCGILVGVGVVHDPRLRHVNELRTWICSLNITEITGNQFSTSSMVCEQQSLDLWCSGNRWSSFGTQYLRHGDIIHAVAKIVQRPRYNALSGKYELSTVLLLNDEVGSLCKLFGNSGR